MLALQLLVNGIVTGSALGVMAVSFALIYATTRVFHVAHAGVYTLGGYLAWTLVHRGVPDIPALVLAMAGCVVVGSLIQILLYGPLDRRGAAQLVVLIASLGALAVIQNLIAAVYSPDILEFPPNWAGHVFPLPGGLRLTGVQIATVVVDFIAFGLTLAFAHRTLLGKRIRAVASNPFLAEITRLEPRRVHVYVMAIASALVCLPGVLGPLDYGLQPYGGVTPLLTATIAMIAGGIGSLAGAFALAVAIVVLQNLALLVMPGEWSIGVTFAIFVVFMLLRPRGLFAGKA
jgi:branched-chain amino acid transport system permease protein